MNFLSNHYQPVLMAIAGLLTIGLSVWSYYDSEKKDRKIAEQQVLLSQKSDTIKEKMEESLHELDKVNKNSRKLLEDMYEQVAMQKQLSGDMEKVLHKNEQLYQASLKENEERLENDSKRLKLTFESVRDKLSYLSTRLSDDNPIDGGVRTKKLGEIVLSVREILKSQYDNRLLSFNYDVDSVWKSTVMRLDDLSWQFLGYEPLTFDEIFSMAHKILIEYVTKIQDILAKNDGKFYLK